MSNSAVTRGALSRPVTAGLTMLMGVFGVWIGLVLSLYPFPKARLVSFTGPLSFWSLPNWGHLFIAFGVLQLIRMLFLWHRGIDFGLHLLAMVVIIMWTVSTFFGPVSTAQPAYTFVSVVTFMSPFITDIINGTQKRLTRQAAQANGTIMPLGTTSSAGSLHPAP